MTKKRRMMMMTMLKMIAVEVVFVVMLAMVVWGVLLLMGSTMRSHERCFEMHPPVSSAVTTTMSTMPSNHSTTLATTQSLTVRLASLVTVFVVCLGEL
jgi:hypothetical protein